MLVRNPREPLLTVVLDYMQQWTTCSNSVFKFPGFPDVAFYSRGGWTEVGPLDFLLSVAWASLLHENTFGYEHKDLIHLLDQTKNPCSATFSFPHWKEDASGKLTERT